MNELKADRRDIIALDKGRIRVPARIKPHASKRLVAMPADRSRIRHPHAPDRFPFEFPSKAFNGAGELIVFVEGDVCETGANGTIFPTCLLTGIANGSFSHELGSIEDYSADSLLDFVNEHGWFFLPCLDSQRRFLDARYRRAFMSDMTAAGIELSRRLRSGDAGKTDGRGQSLEVDEDDGSGTLGGEEEAFLADLSVSVYSIWDDLLRRTVSSPYLCMPDSPELDDVVAAISLSEYARRRLRDEEGAEVAAVSYYEVLVSVRLLQESILMAEELDIELSKLNVSVDGLTAFIDSIGGRGSRRIQMLHHTIRGILDNERMGDLEKLNSVHWNYERELRAALGFLSRFATSCDGVVPLSWSWKEADGDDIYGPHSSVSMKGRYLEEVGMYESELLDPRSYLDRVFPEFFISVYSEGSYSSAVAAQFLDVLRADAEWKVCKNPECRRYFKYKYVPGNEQKGRRQGDYCCERCGNAYRNAYNNEEGRVIKDAIIRLSHMSSGYEFLEEALESVESRLISLYQGEMRRKLPAARKRWRRKLEEGLLKMHQ